MLKFITFILLKNEQVNFKFDFRLIFLSFFKGQYIFTLIRFPKNSQNYNFFIFSTDSYIPCQMWISFDVVP